MPITQLADVTTIDAGYYQAFAITVPPVLLSIATSGNGSVERSPIGDATGPDTYHYPTGASVGLTQQPQAGHPLLAGP